MKKETLQKKIAKAFSDVVYPHNHDFYRAIADREYQDYESENQIKKWHDVTKDDLIKYYDFIFFLDEHGVIYYLPAYMHLIIKHDEVAMHESPQSLFMELVNVDLDRFNEEQLQAINDFLIYCCEVIQPQHDLDEVLLKNALDYFQRQGGGRNGVTL